MYKTVYELNHEELEELKESFFHQEETQDIIEDSIICSSMVPDEIIFNHYEGISFVSDDFFCNQK